MSEPEPEPEQDKPADTAAAATSDGVGYTLIVTLVLCVVCSLVVSAAAVGLHPLQEANRSLDRQRNILLAAGLYDPERRMADLFDRIESRWVDLSSGRFVDTPDRDAREELISIPKPRDLAGIKARPRYVEVYVVREEGMLHKVILPIEGLGLYSMLHGFIAIAGDGNTVQGLRFYEHGETPGLGGEVDNPRWLGLWPGKRIYDGGDEPRLRVVKGGVDPDSGDAPFEVDALSGATLTSRGVSRMLQYWFGEDGYGPFLANLRRGEV